MQTHHTEITGAEKRRDDGGLFDALVEFYRAFNEADMSGLEAIWFAGEAISQVAFEWN